MPRLMPCLVLLENVKSGFCGQAGTDRSVQGDLFVSYSVSQVAKGLEVAAEPNLCRKLLGVRYVFFIFIYCMHARIHAVLKVLQGVRHSMRKIRSSPLALDALAGQLLLVVGLLCASPSCRVDAQTVTEFDTTTGGFQIRCDSVDPPALCAFDESYKIMSYTIVGGEGDLYDPKATGIMPFFSIIEYIRAEDCEEESCSFFCDDVCSCSTGTVKGGFEPDGGSCAILSSNPGTVPTSQPTQMPTASPTFDPMTGIMYNATEMIEPSVLRVRCGGNWPILDSYCAQVSGNTRLGIGDADTYGWSNCDQNGDDCVVSCSPDCTCEVATLNDDGDYDESAPTTPCEVIEPTPAPTEMPTMAPPTTSSAGSVSICRLMTMLMISLGLFLL